MFTLPKIEKITRDVTISHFFLMFGYRVFSLYFPLFLLSRGFSFLQVGYNYLLIYLPIALFAPIAGFLNHKISPAILAAIGISGYGIYALGMILIIDPALFYLWQVLLGISAALFFVSSRAILISAQLENPDRAFGWFYSAPYYAGAIAPAVGAAIIWKFNFLGVFIFGVAIQILTVVFYLKQLAIQRIQPLDKHFNLQKFSQNYREILPKFTQKNILFPTLSAFSVLLLNGFYMAFFILLLKDLLGWSQNLILFYISFLSLLFLPASLFIISRLRKFESEKNIFRGGVISGFFSILFGVLLPFLNFFTILLTELGRSASSLFCGAARSGLITQKLKETPEEAGAVDTIFSPLGIAFGALISGLIIGFLGYQLLFILGGAFVVLVTLLSNKLAKF